MRPLNATPAQLPDLPRNHRSFFIALRRAVVREVKTLRAVANVKMRFHVARAEGTAAGSTVQSVPIPKTWGGSLTRVWSR